MHPVIFFTQGDSINALIERFGCHLEQLDRSQKIQIRLLLTNFLLGQDQMGEEYTLGDAWQDSSLYLLTADDFVIEVADILTDLTIAQAEGLLFALQEQCTIGNARLKSRIEITTETLAEYGVPEELASAAAIILREVDGERARTPQEQEVINQMYQMVKTRIQQRRETKAISQ